MVQSVGIWFANEAKKVVGDPESTTQSLGKARINKPGKQWNKRLVAAELHAKRLSEIYQQLIQEYTGDGQATLRTYSSALSTLIGELTMDDLAECQETAEMWNREPPPKEVQQKSVDVIFHHRQNDSS